MIDRLIGLCIDKENGFCVLNVSGVGYGVFCSEKTLSEISLNQEIILFTVLKVSDLGHFLYGFSSKEERECFNLFQTVQGCGAKLSLALLSHFDIGLLSSAIEMGEIKTVSSCPGVGPKLAARIVSELKGKLTKFCSSDSSTKSSFVSVEADALSALQSFGYSSSLAQSAIQEVSLKFPGSTVSEIIKKSMQILMSKKG